MSRWIFTPPCLPAAAAPYKSAELNEFGFFAAEMGPRRLSSSESSNQCHANLPALPPLPNHLTPLPGNRSQTWSLSTTSTAGCVEVGVSLFTLAVSAESLPACLCRCTQMFSVCRRRRRRRLLCSSADGCRPSGFLSPPPSTAVIMNSSLMPLCRRRVGPYLPLNTLSPINIPQISDTICPTQIEGALPRRPVRLRRSLQSCSSLFFVMVNSAEEALRWGLESSLGGVMISSAMLQEGDFTARG